MNKRVLVVEDEVDIRDALETSLKVAGYDVLLAGDGQVGLEMALANKPDLILLDLKMPKVDGHQMLRMLRVDPWGSTAKVIILTSSADVKSVEKAYQGAVHDYIIKSNMSLKEVLKVVSAVLHTGD